MTPQQAFEQIREKMCLMYDGVTEGKMMSSQAIKRGGKVFAFFHHEQMGFKLGKDADPERPELVGATYLSPFKHKPPMKAWFVVPFTSVEVWEQLAEEAMEKV